MLTQHDAHELTQKIKLGFEVAVIVPIIFFGLVCFIIFEDPAAASAGLAALLGLAPIWLPFFILKYFWIYWIHYVRYKFWFAQETVLLEVQLPPTVDKSPLAMELFLTALWNSGGETTFIKRMWEGATRPVWSLEIASVEGRVNFYIHMRRGWRAVVEARLYGQYPEAQVREVEDYTRLIPFNITDYDLWGAEYMKAPPQALPIKTYVNYGLDKDPDEEFKVDPISNILETLATMKEGEYMWLQFILKAHSKDEWYGFYDTKNDSFKSSLQKGIADIMAAAAKRAESLVTDPNAKAQASARGLTLLTPGEREKVEAMEKGARKLLFEAGLRGIYVARKDRFNGINAAHLVRMFDGYRDPQTNGLTIARWISTLNYPWQDFMDIRKNGMKKKLFFLYQNRAYFYVPHDQLPNLMNVEELASIWHFPSSIVATPGLNRVASTRSEAPPNLPSLPS